MNFFDIRDQIIEQIIETIVDMNNCLVDFYDFTLYTNDRTEVMGKFEQLRVTLEKSGEKIKVGTETLFEYLD